MAIQVSLPLKAQIGQPALVARQNRYLPWSSTFCMYAWPLQYDPASFRHNTLGLEVHGFADPQAAGQISQVFGKTPVYPCWMYFVLDIGDLL